MKKALFWILLTAAAVVLLRFPSMVESSIPSIYYVTPSATTYEQVLSCTGTLQAATIHEIYLQSAALPKHVPVEVGDHVAAGELLLELTPANQLGGETLALLRSYPTSQSPLGEVDLATVATLYGLSSTLGGGLTDYTDLAGLLALAGQEQTSQVHSGLHNPDQTLVHAPTSGIVTALSVRENVPALPGISLVTISDTSAYKVLASVPEGEISKVHIGDEANVRCSANPARSYGGTVSKIYPIAHKVLRGTTTETVVDVEITLSQTDDALMPGFTARVDILAGEDYSLITVPYEAIRQDENNEEFVYVYQDGKLKKNLITTGRELTSEVEILYGLNSDDIVIYNPGDILHEGAIINLKGRAELD